ncbi:Trypsin [Popillia japonica]|uniref:Trypsin n=1 Tax=Popillia japonica TaxID=7064 RepID=A0AAW1JEV9_POPJA
MYASFLFINVCLYVVVNGYQYIEKGEACRTPEGQQAVCVHFNDCPSAIEAIRNRKPPETCSYEGIFPIVCCPDGITSSAHLQVEDRLKNSDTTPIQVTPPFDVRSGDDTENTRFTRFDSANLSLRKCRDYQIQMSDIYVNDSIDASAIKQYSHMALLGYVDDENRIRWKCTGSLISEKFVLTTGRCAKAQHIGKLKYVQLGQHDINSNISDAERRRMYNDIGLVELATPVEFTQFISPACLAVSGNFDNPSLQTVGYGLLQLREKLGKHLVQLSPVEDCKQIYASNPVIRSDNVEVICSKVIDENGECYVDIGGPLQLINTRYEFGGFTEIVGVYLFGSSCDQH